MNMAQIMAQRQAMATKTKLTQKQSTETVQVMLYTSVSAVATYLVPPSSLADRETRLACFFAYGENNSCDSWNQLTRRVDCRGIFPPLAFDTVEFAEDDELYSFQGLMNDEHPRRAQPTSPSSTSTRSSGSTSLNVPLLKRGRSVRVDQFLDSFVG